MLTQGFQERKLPRIESLNEVLNPPKKFTDTSECGATIPTEAERGATRTASVSNPGLDSR
jgi:hypothetical protein